MRALVVSDIHGNWAALEAVLAEPHDAVICLGDLVGYGPEPGAVIRWARGTQPICVQGNHDHAAADGSAPRCRPTFERLAAAVAPLTRAQLGGEDLAYLSTLPRWAFPPFGGGRMLCVHATPRDTLYRYLGPDPDAWWRELEGTNADVVLVGHTHLAFELLGRGRQVVNPGSVVQPKDGDPRAAYAVIADGRIVLKRVAYPVERTIRALASAGLPPDVTSDLTALLQTGRVPPHLR